MSTYEAQCDIIMRGGRGDDEDRDYLNMLLCAAARADEFIPYEELEGAAQQMKGEDNE